MVVDSQVWDRAMRNKYVKMMREQISFSKQKRWRALLKEQAKKDRGLSFLMRRIRGVKPGSIGAVWKEGKLVVGEEAKEWIMHRVGLWFTTPSCASPGMAERQLWGTEM